MKVASWHIGELEIKLPIVQGGMGVGISLAGLAAAVANCGGLGVISGVESGFDRADYAADKQKANAQGLISQLQQARAISPHGVIGVNIMVALNNYAEMVQAAVAGEADIIFSGAGLPLDLPELTARSPVKLAPIVSSARAATLICRRWQKRYGRVPDAIVLEGPLAGGHLGFSLEELEADPPQLLDMIPEVVQAIAPFATASGPIPVIAAGGLWTGHDIAQVLQAGATAAQLGSRFVPTEECDASLAFKQEYLRATADDVVLIKSPVGLPGRAIRNSFLEKVQRGETSPIRCAYNCLQPCTPETAPYCIAIALISAQRGKFTHGFAFAGANAWRAERIETVKNVIDDLIAGVGQA
jgi:NAD(P)H-dependent flavin oxidoreductase YrpB (nitropropane dioxygenase family)